MQSLEQFISIDSAQISMWSYMINLFLTLIFSYLLSKVYRRYGNSLSNRDSFGKNFVLLAMTTMIIITIVKSSLALSLGLVGALSIVRFRAAIKEPEELTYLFLNIALGLGFGADQRLPTIIGALFIVMFIIIKAKFIKNSDDENQNLIISISSKNTNKDLLNDIIEILKKYCVKVDLKRFDETSTIFDSSFIIEVVNFEQLNILKNELHDIHHDMTISIIDNKLIL